MNTRVSGAIRVAVIDDQELVRTGFAMILDSEPDIDVVGSASDGSDAMALVRQCNPDVVLMDVRMPILDGVEATRLLVSNREAQGDGPRVIILTTFDLDEYVFAALRAGASGFLLKDTPPDDLVAAIRVVASGDALLAPSVTRRLIEEFQSGGGGLSASEDPGLDHLTDRETEVLVEMARGRSNSEIGEALFVSETTVKTHVGRVLTKLGVRDRVQAVVRAYESGLVKPGT